jgi:AraC-like DNA-binding protein
LWPEDQTFSLERKKIENEYIFIHTLTEMITELDGETVVLPSGTCICYPPGSRQYIQSVEGGLLHDWAHFSVAFATVAEKYGLRMLFPYKLSNDSFVTDIMQDIEIEMLGKDSFCEQICDIKVHELVAKIMRASQTTYGKNMDEPLYKAFYQARTYIHMNYRENWDIQKMAELVHLSPSRFFYHYKEIFGVSPKGDLLNIRMEHACRFLLHSDFSVGEVAELTGFMNVYHFIRYFKKHTGQTPGQYRKQLC